MSISDLLNKKAEPTEPAKEEVTEKKAVEEPEEAGFDNEKIDEK